MEYKICKLQFTSGIHLGNGMLTDGEPFISADTIFSALCHEAEKMSGGITKLYQLCKDGKILISDALPYIRDILYVPKPVIHIQSDEDGDSIKKKAFKKLKYIPIEKLDIYISGKLNAVEEVDLFQSFGSYELRTNAAIHDDKDTEPYHVGVYHYNEGNGLYICIAYDSKEEYDYILEIIDSLSYSGIGGRRSSGLGKFIPSIEKCPKELEKRFSGDKYSNYISLSFSLPREEELEKSCEEAQYVLKKRSGFVASTTYSNEFRKKKDFYGFAAGSCVKNRYHGDIYDVSHEGRHPVYRYAIPLFMGVEHE